MYVVNIVHNFQNFSKKLKFCRTKMTKKFEIFENLNIPYLAKSLRNILKFASHLYITNSVNIV